MNNPTKTQEYKKCNICNKVYIGYIKEKRKYCSSTCMGISNRVDKTVNCDNCGKPCRKNSRNSKFKHHFCGVACLRIYRKENGGTRYKHGMSYAPEHRAWDKIKRRCYSENDNRYKNYGGRGIKMCERWKNSFESFYEDMGDRPSSEHSIDRIDVNGDYEPSNCRWATSTEQSRNKMNSLFVNVNGKEIHLKEIAEIHNIGYETLLHRFKKGMGYENLIKPVANNENRLCKYGHLISENPYTLASGKRECRKCVRRRFKEYRERLKLKKASGQ